VSTAERARVVGRIADHLAALDPGHPLRVGVDGITAAGKTTLAGELCEAVAARGRAAVGVPMDGFHRPRAHRYRRGRESAEGYYLDAYDLGALADLVLMPLGPGGDRRFAPAIIDVDLDEPVDERAEAPSNAILIVDGSFLQRPEVAGLFDEVIFVDTGFELARERGSRRDAARFGGLAEARRLLEVRYHGASRLYLGDVDARAAATIVVTNDDPGRPVVERIGGRDGDTVALFSYGTLRQPEVQRSSFGRLLDGRPDSLPGFATEWVEITDPNVVEASGSDRHPIVSRTDDNSDTVDGTRFEITPAELAAADRYEVDDYRRVLAQLASGTNAWVYTSASDG
jgi:uridine kinase